MPAGKRRQSNAMLYTLITFVGLFVVAATAAVIYYVKAEDLRTQAKTAQDELNKFASQEEVRSVGTIVGNRLSGQTNLGTMVDHMDQMVALVRGTPVRATSAEVKLAEVRQALQPLLEKAKPYLTLPPPIPAPADANAARITNVAAKPGEPNAPALLPVALATVIGDLLATIEKTNQDKTATQQQLTKLQGNYDDALKVMAKTRDDLTAAVKVCQDDVEKIRADYAKLSASLEATSKEQLGVIQGDLAKATANVKRLNDDLLKAQAELNVTEGRLSGALAQVNEIKPAPDKEAPAFQPDGEVFLVDQSAGVVHINLGSDDRIYQGLTFSVYDRSAGIPRDGKPKAQIEVFAIEPKVAAARVLSFDRKNPIATGDWVANLIWDPGKQNQFVVVGDFDVNGDGKPEYDGVARVEALIQRWGGVIAKDITARTDYVILGTEPKVPAEPTPQVLTADPTAQEKYDAARQQSEHYAEIRRQAESLDVPIFNYDRFLYFTGYASQVGKPGAL
jgi:hypothetical protein